MLDRRDADLAACFLLCYLSNPPGVTLSLLACMWLCYRQWDEQQRK